MKNVQIRIRNSAFRIKNTFIQDAKDLFINWPNYVVWKTAQNHKK
jgi:hypothetical protein